MELADVAPTVPGISSQVAPITANVFRVNTDLTAIGAQLLTFSRINVSTPRFLS
jgi:hypothetical protein